MRTLLALALVLSLPAIVHANGRPPLTNGVYFRPGDNQSIYVRTTFGLLISRDDGCSFRWVCEKAIGYGGDSDPKYAVASDGAIFATTFEGLRVSRDGGCTWTSATAKKPAGDPGRVDGLWVDAIDIGPSGDVWIATAESAGANNVYRSTDNGVTFTPRGMLSPTVWWKSVRVAPSRAQRVYVTGYQVSPSPQARLYRSDDAGETWQEQALTAMTFGPTPIVLVHAVDPKEPNTILVSSVDANPPTGDLLYRSTDGGATFTRVLATADDIRDVFYAADGTVYVATLGGGSFRSTNGGATFTPLEAPPQFGCLGQRGDGALIGCGANWQPDFKAVARSSDASQWTKVFRFVELAGPLQCAAGTTVHTECEPMWPALQQTFGATGPTGPQCSVPVDLPVPPKPNGNGNGNGGCCSANNSPTSPAALALLLATLLLRRRRSN